MDVDEYPAALGIAHRVLRHAPAKEATGYERGTITPFGSAEPWLTWNAGDLIVLDPAAKPAVSVYSVNVPELRV